MPRLSYQCYVTAVEPHPHTSDNDRGLTTDHNDVLERRLEIISLGNERKSHPHQDFPIIKFIFKSGSKPIQNITSHHPLDDPPRFLAPARDDLRDLGPPHVLGPAPLEEDFLQVPLGVRELERDAVRERERLRGVPADERRPFGDGVGRARRPSAVEVVKDKADVVVIDREFATVDGGNKSDRT